MTKNAAYYLLLFGFLFLINACSSIPKSGITKKSVPEKSTKTQLRKDIAQYAKRFKGVRYKYAGKTPKTGFDCSGFTSYVYRKFDIIVSPGSKYQAQLGKKKSLKNARAGDLLFFGKRGKVTHVALITKNSNAGIEVVHATSSRGVMEQNVTQSSYWKPKIMFARDVLSK